MPAMLAELLARPEGSAGRIFEQYFPRVLNSVGGWLTAETRAGRIRNMPIPLLLQQLIGPLVTHLLFRPVLNGGLAGDHPTVEEACEVFADGFLRAVTTSTGSERSGSSAAAYQPSNTPEGES